MQGADATRAVIKKRTVPVKAHTRQIAAKPSAAGIAAGAERYKALGTHIAQQQYASKTPQQRAASRVAARKAGDQRTRTQRVYLGTHASWVQPASQGRSALARRYSTDTATQQRNLAKIDSSKPAKVRAPKLAVPKPSVIQQKLATDAAQAKALRLQVLGQALPRHKPGWLARSTKSSVLGVMKEASRVGTGIGAEALGRIGDPVGQQSGRSTNTFVEGFKHPEQHYADWNKVAEKAGVHNKVAQSALAFGAAVGTDPLTFLTGGVGTAAKEAAAAAARKATLEGATKAEAIRAGRAAEDALGPAGQRRSLKIGLRGAPVRVATGGAKREIMTPATSGKARQAIVDAARKRGIVHHPIVPKAREGLRGIVGNPNVKPAGWTEYQWEVAKHAGNAGRAAERATSHIESKVAHRYQNATADWSDAQHLKVLKAVEAKNLSGLDDAERRVAEAMQHDAEVWYRNEPARGGTARHKDAKVGWAAGPPATPTFQHVVEHGDIAASRATMHEAAQKLQEAEAAAKAASLTKKGTPRKKLPAMAYAEVDQAKAAAEKATRAHVLLRQEGARQRQVIRDFTRELERYHLSPAGYVPRPRAQGVIIDNSRRASGRGPTVGGSMSYQGRKLPALEHMTPEQLGQVETNIPRLMMQRAAEHARVQGAVTQHQYMAGLGDVVSLTPKAAKNLKGVRDMRLFARDDRGIHPMFNGETGEIKVDDLVGHVNKGHEIIQVDPRKYGTIQQLVSAGRADRKVDVSNLLKVQQEGPGNILQRTYRGWKWWATAPNPSYHARNLVGDTFNAMLAGTTSGDFAHAFKLNRANSALRHVEASLTSPDGRRAVKALRDAHARVDHYPATGPLSDLELIGLANKHGAINTGIISGELREVQGAAGEGPIVKALHLQAPRDQIQKVGDWRENVVRLATFRNGLKRGLSPEEAAAYSLRHHIDYSNLSAAERNYWRYAFPFWTWWSRNVPLQVSKMATRPGVYANVEKARTQSLIAAGVDPAVADTQQAYDQENLPWGTPFKMNVAGKRDAVVAGPGLPYMDVGSIPIPQRSFAGSAKPLIQDLFSRANPIVKTPAEILSGINPFTLQPHEQFGEGKYVPAPSWLPADTPGVKTAYDKKTGKMMKQVNWRVLAAIGALPVAQRAGRIATPDTAPGKPTANQVLAGWATGPRYAPVDDRQLKLNQLYDQRNQVDSWLSEHKSDVPHKSGVKWTDTKGGKAIAAQYTKRSEIDKQINLVKKALGYKNVKSPGRPRGAKGTIPGGFGGGSFGGTFNSGGFGG